MAVTKSVFHVQVTRVSMVYWSGDIVLVRGQLKLSFYRESSCTAQLLMGTETANRCWFHPYCIRLI